MTDSIVNIVSRFTGNVLFSIAAASLKDAVIAAVKSRANLSGADLSRANLSGANLYGADLSGADLSGANLYGANLSGADLSRANLSGANLYGADLSGADLSRANLSGADLYGANLSRANLSGADLSGADLSRANLSGADLSGADLSRANLSGANLSGADLYGADLSRANLSGANLYGANLYGADLKELKNAQLVIARTLIVPESGPFVGWKKCQGGVIVKLGIPTSASRSNASGRKCRASHAKVLEILGGDGKTAVSQHDSSFTYKLGKIARCNTWEADRWTECGGGIHFYITRIEAENHS